MSPRCRSGSHFGTSYSPSEGGIQVIHTRGEVQKVTQSGILSVIALVSSAKSQKWLKVVILSYSSRARSESSTIQLLPINSTSSVIIGGVDRSLSKHLPFLSYLRGSSRSLFLEEE